MFYNTTRLTGHELARELANARCQESRILALFRRHGSLTPTLALRHYTAAGFPAIPPTSVRRAITVLTTAGALVKTDVLAIGAWSKPEHVWQLADHTEHQAAA